VPISIWLKWALFLVSNGILGAGTMMLIKGTMPPPMSDVKVGPIFATTLFIVGMTGLIVFGEADLLNVTLAMFIEQ